MTTESIEQTIFKLRDRVAFLERANTSLSADRRRVVAEFERCEQALGGLGGLSLSGAIASRLAKIERHDARRKGVIVARNASRYEILSERHPRDTGLISDEFLAAKRAVV